MQAKHVVLILYSFLVFVVLTTVFGLNFKQHNSYVILQGQKVELIGNIVSAPEINSSGSQIVIFKPDNFKQYLRVSLFRPAYLKNGDRVLVSGRIQLPNNFSSYNYVRYLEMKGVYAEVRSPEVLVLESNETIWLRVLRLTKNQIVKNVMRSFDSEKSGLILGMLIGESTNLPKNMSESYSKVGLTHILVVSGFNLTIIATSLSYLFKITGRRVSLFISLVGVWFFVFLTGASSGVVRAGIMATVFLLARSFGRLHSSFYALLLTVVVMVILNPLRLVYDIGLQLSISATYGVLAVYRMQNNFEMSFKLLELILPTIGAIVFTLPLVAYYFGTLSIISPLANLVVLPLIPIEMLLGALSLAPIISEFSNNILHILLELQNWFVNYLASLHWAQLAWSPDLLHVCIYYCSILFAERLLIWRSKIRLKNSPNSGTITEIII